LYDIDQKIDVKRKIDDQLLLEVPMVMVQQLLLLSLYQVRINDND